MPRRSGCYGCKPLWRITNQHDAPWRVNDSGITQRQRSTITGALCDGRRSLCSVTPLGNEAQQPRGSGALGA